MRRPIRIFLALVGLYGLAWAGYVVKSAAGINLLAQGGHHGGLFPGSDPTVGWLRRG